jgi:YD repeat-containing protein
MKPLILISVLMLFGACFSYSNQYKGKYQNDLKDENLKGKVKFYTSYLYNNEAMDKPASYGFKVNYNKQGNITSTYIYNGKNAVQKINYAYDTAGRKTLTTNQSGHIMSQSTYSYDSRDRIIEVISSGTHASMRIIYNSRGYRDTMFSYDLRGNFHSKVIYHYDDQGNNTGVDRYGQDGRLEQKQTRKFDKQHQTLEEIEYGTTGVRESKVQFRYDSKGNQVMEIDSNKFYVGGSPMNKGTNNTYFRIYNYVSYDKTGNWLQRNEVLNNKISRIEKREIEYY